MIHPTRARHLTPRLLVLEPRDTPAGNVTATLVGDELQLIGDAAANSMLLRGAGPGVVEVQGAATTLNGGNGKLTFTGVERLRVTAGDGNDTVRSRGLSVPVIRAYGEGGDDTIHLDGTTRDDRLAVIVYGDTDFAPDTPNGADTILVTNTRVRGEDAIFRLTGDTFNFVPDDARRDVITLTNTDVKLDATGGLNLFVNQFAEEDSGEGDVITIDRLNADAEVGFAGPGSFYYGWIVELYGSGGDDQVRIKNSDLSAHSEFDMISEVYVYGLGGTDTIEVRNTTLSADPSETGFNQVATYLFGERVRVNNVYQQGGSAGGEFGSLTYFYIEATEADLRNVTVTSDTSFAWLEVDDQYFHGPTGDNRFSLANVTVRGGTPGAELTILNTGEGDDAVSVANSDLGEIEVRLGEGNDTLTLVNVTGDAPYLEFGLGGVETGDGDDSVILVNCAIPNFRIDMGDGDDELTLTNNTFGAIELFGGFGTDRLLIHNNTGLFTIDGFEE